MRRATTLVYFSSLAMFGVGLWDDLRPLGARRKLLLQIAVALGVLVDQTEKKPVKSLFADIREQIRGGKALSAVLETYDKDFSPIYVHMVRAGEASGALDQILFRLAEFLEKQQALRNKVTNAVLYPALMLMVGGPYSFGSRETRGISILPTTS